MSENFVTEARAPLAKRPAPIVRFARTSARSVPAYIFPYTLLALAPIIWFTGLDFFIFHLAAISMVLYRPRTYRPSSPFDLLYLSGIAALCCSLLFSGLFSEVDATRIFAALNNLSILAMGYVLMKAASTFSWTTTDKSALISFANRSLQYSTLFIFIATVGSVFLFYVTRQSIVFPTLFGLATPKMGALIGQYQEVTIVTRNWFLGQAMARTYLLAPYATGSALVIFMIYVIGFPLRRSQQGAMTNSQMSLLVLLAVAISVLATLSRATILSVVACAMMGATYFIFRRYGLMLAAALAGLCVILLLAFPEVISFVNETRAGSSALRFRVYKLSIDSVLNNSPLLGFGVKPRLQDLMIPIGSHSTPISLLVRGGMLGAFPMVICLLVAPFFWTQQILFGLTAQNRLSPKIAFFVASFIPCASYIAVQDVDAYPIVALCIFTYLGLMRSLAASATGRRGA